MGPRLRDLIRHDRWDDLAAVLSDEILDTLVPTGTFDELPGLLRDRFDGLGQGIVVSPPPDERDDEAFRLGRGRAADGLSELAQRGMGKISSSAAMASMAACRSSSLNGV